MSAMKQSAICPAAFLPNNSPAPITPPRQTGARHYKWVTNQTGNTKMVLGSPFQRRSSRIVREGAVDLLQHAAVPPGIIDESFFRTDSGANNPETTSTATSSPDLDEEDVFDMTASHTWLIRKYIESSRIGSHPLVRIDVRPANATLPSDVWFVEYPASEIETWTQQAQIFREICIQELPPIPEFSPQPCLASLVDSWTSNGGVTKTQFSLMCARCLHCGLYTSERSFSCHRCPSNPKAGLKDTAHSDIGIPVQNGVNLFRRFHLNMGNELGITLDELECLFVECPDCHKIVTRASAWYHHSKVHKSE